MSGVTHTPGQVHEMSQKGFGEGTNELYDRARPTYPQEAIQKLWDSLPERARGGPLNVLELACGTGLFTRSLFSHPQFSAHTTTLIAVDPSSGMRRVFTERMSTDPRVKGCYEGTFDKLPPEVPEGWADVVCIAQAWHWCGDHDDALKEILRVMKPDAVLLFIWNIEDRQKAAWLLQLKEIYQPYAQGRSSYGDRPDTQLERAGKTAECETYKANFAPQETFECEWAVPVTAQGAIDRVFSKSFMTLVKGEERDAVAKQMEECLKRGEGLVWVDKEAGTFEWPYKTYSFIMKRK